MNVLAADQYELRHIPRIHLIFCSSNYVIMNALKNASSRGFYGLRAKVVSPPGPFDKRDLVRAPPFFKRADDIGSFGLIQPQRRPLSASLIGRSGSSAFRLSTTAASMSLTGSFVIKLESGPQGRANCLDLLLMLLTAPPSALERCIYASMASMLRSATDLTICRRWGCRIGASR